MSNEERILQILTSMQADISELKTGQAQTNDRLDRLEAGQARLERKIDRVETNLKKQIDDTSDFLLDEIERRMDFRKWSETIHSVDR